MKRFSATNDVSLTGTRCHRRKRFRRRGSRSATAVKLVGLTTALSLLVVAGCGLVKKIPPSPHDTKASYHDDTALNIEYPEVAECATPVTMAAEAATLPLTLDDPSELPTLEMTLEEAVSLAVQQSPVLRSIGGTVVTSPNATPTVYDPGLVASNVQQGAEAALAAFDAQYTQQLFWFNNDVPNNIAPGGLGAAFTPSVFTGTNATFTNELAKTTALGSRFAIRHVVNYTRNNRPFRAFSSAFEGWVEVEWRQPLLQGAGTTYNRIAGPNSQVGQYNGVLIGRLNEDVALADFEAGVIQLVADVEQAYWDLYAAYRILDAQVKGRDASRRLLEYQESRLKAGAASLSDEAQARSQFYQFQAQVEQALGGAVGPGGAVNVGAANGLFPAEQRLRYLIGLQATDGRLIRPISDPMDMKIVFDWEAALGQALVRRVEVRRQRLAVKRRELELVAARLNYQPRLDFLAQYRWRGLGDNLIGDTTGGPLDNLYGTIAGGRYQEGQAGIELNFPVGFRAAGLAIANARLNLKRERALLADLELRISHDLSNAARQIDVAYRLMETNYSRIEANLTEIEVLLRRYTEGLSDINFLLQAQRSAVTSTVEFYQSVSAYNLAIREFHRQKGSLLAYNHVELAEGPWAPGARYDAYQVGRFLHPRPNPEKTMAPRPLTSGPFDPSEPQSTLPFTGPVIEMAPDVELQDGAVPAEPTPAEALPAIPSLENPQLPPVKDVPDSNSKIPGDDVRHENTIPRVRVYEIAEGLIDEGPSWVR